MIAELTCFFVLILVASILVSSSNTTTKFANAALKEIPPTLVSDSIKNFLISRSAPFAIVGQLNSLNVSILRDNSMRSSHLLDFTNDEYAYGNIKKPSEAGPTTISGNSEHKSIFPKLIYKVPFGVRYLQVIISPGITSSNVTENNNANTSSPLSKESDSKVSIVLDSSSKTDRAFLPNPIIVKQGRNVTWTNNDDTVHIIAEGNGTFFMSQNGFGSELLDPGNVFTYRFDKNGTVSYFCSIHPTMVGKVMVQP